MYTRTTPSAKETFPDEMKPLLEKQEDEAIYA